MKRMTQSASVLLAIALLSICNACQKQEDVGNMPNSVTNDQTPDLKRAPDFNYGYTLPFGNGAATAWSLQDNQGNQTSVGITLTKEALEGLSDTPESYVLNIPPRRGRNFYTHIMIDWNPLGHEPSGVYDKPHFDVHFYTIPNALRLTIPQLLPPAMDRAVASEFVPPMYLQIPGMIPEMGSHWVDLLAPEFNGDMFTKTFIWGSYKGKFIFWEPMVTLDYLLSHPDETTDIRQPQHYQKEGLYPQSYQVSWSEYRKEYSISLTNMVYRHEENKR